MKKKMKYVQKIQVVPPSKIDTSIIDPIERKLKELDLKMSEVLLNPKLSSDEKVLLYFQALQEFKVIDNNKRGNKTEETPIINYKKELKADSLKGYIDNKLNHAIKYITKKNGKIEKNKNKIHNQSVKDERFINEALINSKIDPITSKLKRISNNLNIDFVKSPTKGFRSNRLRSGYSNKEKPYIENKTFRKLNEKYKNPIPFNFEEDQFQTAKADRQKDYDINQNDSIIQTGSWISNKYF